MMPEAIDLQALWAQINVELRKASINRSLWEAAGAAKALVIDGDKLAVISARREKGESVREIAAAVGVSPSTVWNALNESEVVA